MASEKYFPKDLYLDEKNHEKFEELVKSDVANALSPFYKKHMKDVFMYALGIGFYKHKRSKLQKKVGTIPVRTLSDSDIALLEAIAVVEKGSLDILLGENIKEAFEIVEEYVNEGITALHNMVFGDEAGNVDKRMEEELREILEAQAVESTSKPSVMPYNENSKRS